MSTGLWDLLIRCTLTAIGEANGGGTKPSLICMYVVRQRAVACAIGLVDIYKLEHWLPLVLVLG